MLHLLYFMVSFLTRMRTFSFPSWNRYTFVHEAGECRVCILWWQKHTIRGSKIIMIATFRSLAGIDAYLSDIHFIARRVRLWRKRNRFGRFRQRHIYPERFIHRFVLPRLSGKGYLARYMSQLAWQRYVSWPHRIANRVVLVPYHFFFATRVWQTIFSTTWII